MYEGSGKGHPLGGERKAHSHDGRNVFDLYEGTEKRSNAQRGKKTHSHNNNDAFDLSKGTGKGLFTMKLQTI